MPKEPKKQSAVESSRKALDNGEVRIRLSSDPSALHTIERIESSPCQVECPAGVQIKGYVGLIAFGKFHEALELIKKDNPLPGICGRVCTHPCEEECNRADLDGAVAICALKRFVADYDLKEARRPEPIPKTRKEKIAIVGSGPAGLTAANDLVRMGYHVTIFESLPKPGGMLVACIPSFRLPRDIIEKEIQDIVDLGVELKTNVCVGKDIKLEDLKKDYDAVLLAIGAHKGRKLGVPGEDENEGVVDCVEFLRSVNMMEEKYAGKKAVIIGGGMSAMDSARTALRLGFDEVRIAYRRTRKEIPAVEAEIVDTENEGVEIDYLVAPVEVLGEDGKVTGMKCIRMELGEPDSSGRRRPVPIEGSEFDIECDLIVCAISQEPDLDLLGDTGDIETTKWNTFKVDDDTLRTSVDGVLSAGDAVTGPWTVIGAMGQGHTAADSIHAYLQKEKFPQEKVSGSVEMGIPHDEEDRVERAPMPKLPARERIRSFDEVDLGFDEETAVREAMRCLRCGPCLECAVCIPACEHRHVVITVDEESGRKEILLRAPRSPERFSPSTRESHGSMIWKDDTGKKESEAAVEIHPIVCTIAEELCRGCGQCVAVCEYEALKLVDKEGITVCEVDQNICRGCGTCASICPTMAATVGYFASPRIVSLIETALQK
jgi:heterodisulfide reductase subunit A